MKPGLHPVRPVPRCPKVTPGGVSSQHFLVTPCASLAHSRGHRETGSGGETWSVHLGAMHQAAGDILQAVCEQSGEVTDGNNAADGCGSCCRGKGGELMSV